LGIPGAFKPADALGKIRLCRCDTKQPMLFASWPFVMLVCITVLVYYGFRRRCDQMAVLIAASAVFYGYGQPNLLVLLFGSAVLNGLTSSLVQRSRTSSTRLAYAVLGVTLNLMILAVFKYGGLVATTLAHQFGGSRSSMVDWLIGLPLPIGISFYTFQGISLVVDEYRRASGAAGFGNIEEFAAPLPRLMADTVLFITLFPQLVAGPILKAHDFFPQIAAKRLADVNFGYAFKALILGYFLKLVVADNLAEHTFWMRYPYCLTQSTVILLMLLVGYSAQIFADFAGYSLIAQGVAALFGYRLFDNFNFPYIASSFSDFWRRWHISLSSWLREYLYIPLGGNRLGAVRTIVNLMLVMGLGGMWHGAAWRYGTWGLLHGLALGTERLLIGNVQNRPDRSWKTLAARWLMTFVVFWFVSFAWLFFVLPSLEEVWAFLTALSQNGAVPLGWWLGLVLSLYIAPIAIYHVMGGVPAVRKRLPAWLVEAAYGAMLVGIVFNHGNATPFIYFQF
jgi:alginate O-acetyltransferase complex protein AlgI